jgi:putative ABC transport system ATP-binding protein
LTLVNTEPRDVLLATGLSLSYGQQQVLRRIDLRLGAGETVAVTGPSGSGKTTLLYALSGLERASSGEVTLLDRPIVGIDAEELSALRLSRVGFVFQAADLVPELTLRQNIALPLELGRAGRRETAERVRELVAALEIEECADRKPNQVSGGQAQRCAVGRAVATRPAVVFADEPTGALDSVNRERVLELLLEQVALCNALLVTVTHDLDVASRFSRRISLADGRVVNDSGVVTAAKS